MNRCQAVAFALLASCAIAQVNVSYRVHSFASKKKGLWDAETRYPVFAAKAPLYRFANLALTKSAKKDLGDFIEMATDGLEGQPKPEQPYYFETKPHVSIATEGLISVYLDESQDIGGAHPMYWYETHSFALVHGKPKEVRLKDLFLPSADPYKQVSDAAIAKLKDSGASLVIDGTVKSLNVKQLDQFCLTPAGITILITPYEVASWAEGPQEVKIKFSELKGLNRSGPLKALLKG